MPERPVALLVADSDQIRESLLIFLRSISRIDTTHQAKDSPSALMMAPDIQPSLVLFDADSGPDELRTTLHQLQVRWSQARYLVFVDNECDCRKALDAGADAVLVKGVRAATILETIENLLSEEL